MKRITLMLALASLIFVCSPVSSFAQGRGGHGAPAGHGFSGGNRGPVGGPGFSGGNRGPVGGPGFSGGNRGPVGGPAGGYRGPAGGYRGPYGGDQGYRGPYGGDRGYRGPYGGDRGYRGYYPGHNVRNYGPGYGYGPYWRGIAWGFGFYPYPYLYPNYYTGSWLYSNPGYNSWAITVNFDGMMVTAYWDPYQGGYWYYSPYYGYVQVG